MNELELSLRDLQLAIVMVGVGMIYVKLKREGFSDDEIMETIKRLPKFDATA